MIGSAFIAHNVIIAKMVLFVNPIHESAAQSAAVMQYIIKLFILV